MREKEKSKLVIKKTVSIWSTSKKQFFFLNAYEYLHGTFNIKSIAGAGPISIKLSLVADFTGSKQTIFIEEFVFYYYLHQRGCGKART